MPKITDSIARALRDNRVSISEMGALIREAKSQPLTAETKAELTNLLNLHADKFGSTATRDLRTFLATANITGTTTTTSTTVTPPPTPAITNPSIADPAVLTKHTTDTTWKPVDGGKLFVDGVSYDDVVQGSIGDCYLVSALSAVAQNNPKAIENAIKDNGDGTFTVRFYEKGSSKQVEIKIDGDIAQSSTGSARYGKSRDSKELWVGLLEKAYAQWKGGYEAIGNGGYPGDVIQALTGRSTSYSSNTYADSTFAKIQRGAEGGKPMTAVTYGKDSGVHYNGTGVYAWHAYTVLGASEENGTRYVQLRNPWGSSEHGSDGKNDGIFKMKLEDFARLYQGVDVGN
ncbi:MAG: C2 family cysteine protease [Archangium sp.]